MRQPKKPLKPRIGRPPLAPGARRDRQLNILMKMEERQAFIDEAHQTGRSVSEHVMRYLRTMREHQDIWDDLAELQQARADIAKRIMLERGWTRFPAEPFGEMLWSPLPAWSSFISDDEANAPMPDIMVSADVRRAVEGILIVFNVPKERRGLIAQAFFKALKGRIPNTATKQARQGAA